MKYFIGLCFLTCSVVPSFGTTINFNSATGPLTSTHNYGGIIATAYGSGSNILYGKSDGGDENGVGISNGVGSSNEINFGQFIQLDLTGITGSITITMGSTTNPDAYTVF